MLRAELSKECGQAVHHGLYTRWEKNAVSAHSIRCTLFSQLLLTHLELLLENLSTCIVFLGAWTIFSPFLG